MTQIYLSDAWCQRVEVRVRHDGTVLVHVFRPPRSRADPPEAVVEHTRLFNEVGYAGDTAPTDAEHNYQMAIHWAQKLLDFGTAPTDD